MESYSLPPTDNCIPVLILFRRESGCGHLSALIPFPLLATIAHHLSTQGEKDEEKDEEVTKGDRVM